MPLYDEDALGLYDLDKIDAAVRAMWASDAGRQLWYLMVAQNDPKKWPLFARYVSEKVLENIEASWK